MAEKEKTEIKPAPKPKQSFLNMLTEPIKKVYNGIVSTFEDLSYKPTKLLGIIFLTVCVLDLILLGNIGIVVYTLTQLSEVFAIFASLNGMHILFLIFALIVFMEYIRKK